MSGTFYNAVTQVIATVGVAANAVLVLLILTRTPNYMKTYAFLLLSSAFGDLIGLLCIIATLPREVIHEQLLVVQFHGICAAFSEEACWMTFGVLQWMFSATCALLTASFALRLAILGFHNVQKTTVCIICIIFVAVFFPVMFMFANTFRIGSSHVTEQAIQRLFVTNTTQLGAKRIIDQTEGFTQVTLNFTILTALVLLILSIGLRFTILRKMRAIQHKLSAQARQGHVMLIRALNIQLPLTSFYFIATLIYVLNSQGILVGDAVDYWTTPIANLQNVLTPMVNLWIIQPYKRSILNFIGCRRAVSPPTSVQIEASAYTHMTAVA